MGAGVKRGTASRQRVAAPPGELGLIRQIQARAAVAIPSRGNELRLGIGDDCAILRPRRGEDLVVTTDFSLEGRHYRRAWHSPESIGHRVLARGLSDLAAMGSRPVAAFLSLALPRSVAADASWVSRFLQGLLDLAKQCKVPLAGGDTSEAPNNAVLTDIVLLGAVPQGRALRRDGARVGDRIFVTGALGGASAQLTTLMQEDRKRPAKILPGSPGTQPHFFPEPRLSVGRFLVRQGATTAALDLSDGLSTDLRHLCIASGVSAEVDTAKIPLHLLLANWNSSDALGAALHGGEDYELLFTVRSDTRMPKRVGNVSLTEIGRIVPSGRGRPRVVLVQPNGRRAPLTPGGWEHLR